MNPHLEFAPSREEIFQVLSTAKASRNLPHVIFLSWAHPAAAETLEAIKNDFILWPIPVVVIALPSTGRSEINAIYGLYANAVVREQEALASQS
jgi:hypothetical protein